VTDAQGVMRIFVRAVERMKNPTLAEISESGFALRLQLKKDHEKCPPMRDCMEGTINGPLPTVNNYCLVFLTVVQENLPSLWLFGRLSEFRRVGFHDVLDDGFVMDRHLSEGFYKVKLGGLEIEDVADWEPLSG
jgi:hypothetical protein